MTRVSDDLNVNQVIGIHEYFQFLLQLTLPFGLLFQMPVVIMFITRLGLVTPMFWRKSENTHICVVRHRGPHYTA